MLPNSGSEIYTEWTGLFFWATAKTICFSYIYIHKFYQYKVFSDTHKYHGKPLAYVFTWAQKNKLSCKHVEISFPVFNLLFSFFCSNTTGKISPCISFLLSAHYTISNTKVCFPAKYWYETFWTSLSKSCFQILPGN